MDFDSLKNQVSNLTLYDLKAGVRKVQNAVMNLTEMESKVREATNGDPWGASASLMQEIAQGTHNYQQLNEIMPMIYKRFTDKTAEEWRQIYKFLCKNGSERVIDDARSHLSLLRMLRQFHYIDPNGKDQGVNVRNRTNELVKLLSDVDAIRLERKKARMNKNKYGGVEGGMGVGGGFSSGGGSQYGGFGSETSGYGGYHGEVYGDGGGFGGRETDFSGTQRRADQFEEYDEAEEVQPTRPTRTTATRSTPAASAKPEAPKPKVPEQDLFEFGDEPVTSSSSGKAPAMVGLTTNAAPANDDDDDFDDFQSATPSAAQPASNALAALSPPPPTTSTTTSSTQYAAPTPLAPGQSASFNNILGTKSPAPSVSSSILTPSASTLASPTGPNPPAPTFPASTGFKSTGPNYFTSVPMTAGQQAPTPTSSALNSRPGVAPSYTSSTSAASLGKPPAKAASGSGDAFGSLWSTASSAAGVNKTATAAKGPDLASLSKAKSQAGIWGAASAASSAGVARPGGGTVAPQPTTAAKPATPLGNGLDDLLG
ncbi:uncharacterized protein A1O9_06787 [Exophiala aquamarina CBS 119918]|uniref:ENTH domain-containing protein n=1 Tax=Exophiala aquamarina CBS 119918 TaxID=1182545 RepID=A0A072PBE8_9EURO|nr:uncharacterized protein A1O9_06787 [Exophiala aquamarina CBS 119918]KEF56598.1 hypothetical protein A1O9_06787 [Exophiala aquamarina CBS 119918]